MVIIHNLGSILEANVVKRKTMMTPEERASNVCDQWEKPHVPRKESPRLDTLIAAAIREAEREATNEIVYDGVINYDKVEVWARGKGFRLRVVLKDPTYGDIYLYSDYYDGLREADSRAFVIARQLGLERDTLPVHKSEA
jgi:hypothetical protein